MHAEVGECMCMDLCNIRTLRHGIRGLFAFNLKVMYPEHLVASKA